jgi:hypothetical protein
MKTGKILNSVFCVNWKTLLVSSVDKSLLA